MSINVEPRPVSFGEDEFSERNDGNNSSIKTFPEGLAKKLAEWARKEVCNEAGTVDRFYLLDCHSSEVPCPKTPTSGGLKHVLRLYGITSEGQTICCSVNGFLPCIYLSSTATLNEEHAKILFGTLNCVLLEQMERTEHMRGYLTYFDKEHPPVLAIEVVKFAKQIYNFLPGKEPEAVLRVSCAISRFLPLVHQVIVEGLLTQSALPADTSYICYEYDINPTQRFLADKNISCCNWIEFVEPVSVMPINCLEKYTSSMAEFDVDVSTIKEEDFSKETKDPIALPKSVRLLSIDIECMVICKRIMPDPKREQVLQIANILATPEDHESSQRNVVFTLGDVEAIPNTDIFSFETEKEMLEAWCQFVVTIDPDIIVGFNIHKFDVPYLLERARAINANYFPNFGRVGNVQTTYCTYENKRERLSPFHDERVSIVPGRVVFDMFPVLFKFCHGEKGFGLNAMALRFLGESKDDLDVDEISKLQQDGPKARARIANYCLQDARLPLKLLLHSPCSNNTHTFLSYFCYMSQTYGMPLRQLLSKSKKCADDFQIIRQCKNPSFKITSLPSFVFERQRNTVDATTGSNKRTLSDQNSQKAPVKRFNFFNSSNP